MTNTPRTVPLDFQPRIFRLKKTLPDWDGAGELDLPADTLWAENFENYHDDPALITVEWIGHDYMTDLPLAVLEPVI